MLHLWWKKTLKHKKKNKDLIEELGSFSWVMLRTKLWTAVPLSQYFSTTESTISTKGNLGWNLRMWLQLFSIKVMTPPQENLPSFVLNYFRPFIFHKRVGVCSRSFQLVANLLFVCLQLLQMCPVKAQQYISFWRQYCLQQLHLRPWHPVCPSWKGLHTQLVANRCTNTTP